MDYAFCCRAARNGVGPAIEAVDGFTQPGPTIGFILSLALSMFLPATGIKTLPVGTDYAVWAGIGAAGTALVGMPWLGEARDVLKLVSLVMLLAGIVGLRITSAH